MAATMLDRLMTKFTVGDGCWEWTAGKTAEGYGKFWTGEEQSYGHRVMYELMVGPIPAGLHVDHLCENKGCVRPDHLEPVPPSLNSQRSGWPEELRRRNLARTHCKNGHEYSSENTRIRPDGARVCITCAYAAQARFLERKKSFDTD